MAVKPKMGLTDLYNIILALYGITFSSSFNIDTKNPYVYSSIKNTYFGYSVAFNSDLRSIVVGAPFSNDTNNGNKPWGSVFSCSYHSKKDRRKCDKLRKVNEIKFGGEVQTNRMMMGATVYSDNYRTIACAPRYQTKILDDKKERTLVNGKCDVIYPSYADQDDGSSWVWRPCVGKTPNSEYGYCQAGFSAKILNSKRLISGCPSFNPSVKPPEVQEGLLTSYSDTSKFTEKSEDRPGDYLGYSIGAGKFSAGGGDQHVASGAPRADNLKGLVHIYQMTSNGFQIYYKINDPAKQSGSYFGSSLVVADIDNNKFEDLAIGAPYYSSGQSSNEGAVYVYMNAGSQEGIVLKQTLYGDKEQDACFGFSIGSIGDLNKDGKRDIVVGAPWGGPEGRGVVYIYYGTDKEKTPLVLKQRLVPKELGGDLVNLDGFGYSFAEYYKYPVESAKPGMIFNDVDRNEFPDLGIGAYRSDSVVIFRSRPVVTIKGILTFSTKKIDLYDVNPSTICEAPDKKKYKCMRVDVAFSLSKPISGGINVEYTLDVDTQQNVKRGFFLDQKGGVKKNTHSDVMNVGDHRKVDTLTLYLVNNTKEIVHEMIFQLKWDIKDSSTCNVKICPVSNQLVDVSVSERIPYIKGCSSDGDDVCNSDLVLKIDKSIDGGGSIQSGITKVVNINAEVKNIGENAFLNTLYLRYPSGIQPEKVVIENYKGHSWKPNYQLVTEQGKNLLQITLSSLIRKNTVEKIFIKFGVSSLIKSTLKQIDLQVNVTTESKEMDPSNNVQKLSIGVILVANLTITGNVLPEQVKWSKDVTSTHVPGKKITHTFLLQNRGPSGVDTSDVVIKFPEKIDDQFILNIVSVHLKSSNDGKPGYCDTGKLNPVGLNDTRLGVQTGKASQNKTLVRRRREVYEGLDCNGKNIGCRIIKCSLKNLKKSDSIELTIISTLVEATFENFIKVNRKIGVTAKFSSKTVQKPTKDAAVDTIMVFITVLSPHVTVTAQSKPLPWWIILICVLAALLIIVIVYTILYKKKFFERKRPPVDEEEELKNGDIEDEE